jgi:predicted DNA-binding protein
MAARKRTDPFAKLSPEEKARYGPAEEWDIEGYVGPRGRASDSAQFSLRVPKTEFDALRKLADARGMTFSDVVREAIAHFMSAAPQHRLSNVTLRISSKDVGVIYASEQFIPDRTVYGAEPQPRLEIRANAKAEVREAPATV